MNDTKSAGLRLPVLAAVDRTAPGAALADGTGVEAQSWFDDIVDVVKTYGPTALQLGKTLLA